MAFKVFGKKIDKIGLLGLSLLGLLVFHMIYGCTICKEGLKNTNVLGDVLKEDNPANANKDGYEKHKESENMLNSINNI